MIGGERAALAQTQHEIDQHLMETPALRLARDGEPGEGVAAESTT